MLFPGILHSFLRRTVYAGSTRRRRSSMEYSISRCPIQLPSKPPQSSGFRLFGNDELGLVVKLRRCALQHFALLHEDLYPASHPANLLVYSAQFPLVANTRPHCCQYDFLHNLLLCASFPLLSADEDLDPGSSWTLPQD